MMRLAKPAPAEITALRHDHAGAAFTYDHVGATRGDPPAGWSSDRQRIVIGHGAGTWQALLGAIRSWRMFDLPWVILDPPQPPIRAGQIIAFASHQAGLYAINLNRIAYVVDDRTPEGPRFGFAYGTLPVHSVRGEELFLGGWDAETDAVWFEIAQFSRVRHPLARLAYPIARAVQRRFTREALRAVRDAVTAAPAQLTDGGEA